MRETVFIFLQKIPDNINKLDIEFVDSLHHTHIWSLEGEHHVFTTQVKLKNINSFSQLLEVKGKVKQIFSLYPFKHYTIETELDEETCDMVHQHD